MKNRGLKNVLLVLILIGTFVAANADSGCKDCLIFSDRENPHDLSFRNSCYGACSHGVYFCGSLWTCHDGTDFCSIRTYCSPIWSANCTPTAYKF